MAYETTMAPFKNVREELRLIHAVDLIHTSSDLTDNIEAINYLRHKACHLDTEAKTKLSIIFNEEESGHLPHVQRNRAEADMWARSVFDKQLSLALKPCAPIFITTDDLSTTHFIDCMTARMNRDGQEPLLNYLAGLLYSKGIGFPQDLQRGIASLKFAATEGRIAEAGCELGRIYSDRYKYSLNEPAESIHWFHRAFECGSTQAVVDLAYGFFEGSEQVPKDDVRALRYAKDGALLNDKYCQYIVGHLYLKGKGDQTKDAQEAVKYLNASASQGFAVALEEETSVYMYGHGNVKQDYGKAFACCMQSIATNIPFCQARLGDMYRNAWGVTQDFPKAFEYYQNAASQSDTPYPYAQHMLGEMFLHGEGVPKDLAVAKEWFQIASTQGYEPSQTKIQQIDLIEANTALQKPMVEEKKQSSRWSLSFFNNTKKK
ncbi:uncharacterized protein EV154DRAFT_444255 [Mucor mucedo]|uniref:uncharacterized protein n=1 Tax=Mucor mucedo TaxID=29922 RepID=UPI002220B042|nr:uncharacterized protein EV154DRAFT_444255 [Mucor mucedo]KAI7890575.1 hypothetical protein EV154DRAFT_444255 [Mucor mucedo]